MAGEKRHGDPKVARARNLDFGSAFFCARLSEYFFKRLRFN